MKQAGCAISIVGVLATLLLAVSARPADEKPIFGAIDRGDVEASRAILKSDPSQLGAVDSKGHSTVLRAIFATPDPNKGFVAPHDNAVLQVLLGMKPSLGFYEACAVGSADQVSALVTSNSNLISSRNSIGWTGLHFAAFGGNKQVIALLIQRGANVNEKARNRFNNTPLAVALLTGQYDTIKLLIEDGADVNARQSGGLAPIQEAALSGRRDIIDLLLEHGAEIAARGNDGRNAVSEANRGHHPEIAAYLLTRGGKNPDITADLTAEPKD
jgi:hypothetical protein